MPCTFFHLILRLCLLPVSLGFAQPFVVQSGGIHARMSLLLPFLSSPITQDFFLPNLFSKNSLPKVLLDICLQLQAGIQLVTSGEIYPLPGYNWNPCFDENLQIIYSDAVRGMDKQLKALALALATYTSISTAAL